ncbi:hypothetical protein FHR83_003958 [Actinoplanes campanulatus]|uniref:Uncharacterized protein n=1 Tax=Actinoplanes campanulatus TaxID=113559 RepID=A0A7W5AHD8_9ACTN|nr:hypothetical protein [Actinoplanes campanulatus]MBB3096288.1 hypothetical protein [Actinoplanes campanulatus]GGN19375.1 hypothetical protein GCM10010109_32820 [Actinoplanes campanulatus]GID41620.1 hypothetical protein Aca09nite_81260 [Actinoplanes campanulatus]
MTCAPATGKKPARRYGRWSLGAILGGVMGLAPHLLHHVGLLAGTALLAGIGGAALFALLGLAAMLPMLLRLRRRFDSWWAPGIAVTVFAAMFAVSTLVIGPALRPGNDSPAQHGPTPSAPASGEHTRHHN